MKYAALLFATLLSAVAAQQDPAACLDKGKCWICHGTSSATNPYSSNNNNPGQCVAFSSVDPTGNVNNNHYYHATGTGTGVGSFYYDFIVCPDSVVGGLYGSTAYTPGSAYGFAVGTVGPVPGGNYPWGFAGFPSSPVTDFASLGFDFGICGIPPPPTTPGPTTPVTPTTPGPTTATPTTGPGGDGDPHIKTWTGDYFDYMGECDLMMMNAPAFDGHKDMNVAIRTTIQYDYSYIEAAAVQIGNDVLEVGSYGDFAVNGVDTPYLGGKAGHIGGYQLVHTQVSKKKHVYDIVLSATENITLASYKQLVSIHINVEENKEKFFSNSKGIIGSLKGELFSRDGAIMEAGKAYAEEWQVTDEEPSLFRVARAPQFPAKCNMPAPKTKTSRRLGQTIAEEAAEKACSHKVGKAFTNCVYDVMATGDLEMALAGAF